MTGGAATGGGSGPLPGPGAAGRDLELPEAMKGRPEPQGRGGWPGPCKANAVLHRRNRADTVTDAAPVSRPGPRRVARQRPMGDAASWQRLVPQADFEVLR